MKVALLVRFIASVYLFQKAHYLLTCAVCLHCSTLLCTLQEEGVDVMNRETAHERWVVHWSLFRRRKCSSCSALKRLVEGHDFYVSVLCFFSFSVSHPNTQRGPGSHADEPVLGRELESGNDHTHSHTRAHTHTPTAISVWLIDWESLSSLHLPWACCGPGAADGLSVFVERASTNMRD